MPFYELPEFKAPEKFKNFNLAQKGAKSFKLFAGVIFASVVFGFLAGAFSSAIFYFQIKDYLIKTNNDLPLLTEKETIVKEYLPQTSQEEKIIRAVKESFPAVVSIVISKDVPILEEYYERDPFGFLIPIPQYRQKGTKKQEIGGGTGFIVSKDGLILTNKHVVLEEDADYTVFTSDGKKFQARVLARDPFQDLAVMKIEQKDGESFPTLNLGDSDSLQSGQTVVAIGFALGEFRNTVSVGVISGLGRRITAAGGGLVETLEDVIQTDAAINKGNSGGPLLNLKGEVIGVNTAMASGAQNIGFAIPINKAKKAIEQVKEVGKIVYPFLGIRYILVTEEVQKEYGLSVDHGALIVSGDSGEPAIWPGSAAEKAGLKKGDIILEFNGDKITSNNSLAKIIMRYNPGDRVALKILRKNKEFRVEVVLGERNE